MLRSVWVLGCAESDAFAGGAVLRQMEWVLWLFLLLSRGTSVLYRPNTQYSMDSVVMAVSCYALALLLISKKTCGLLPPPIPPHRDCSVH